MPLLNLNKITLNIYINLSEVHIYMVSYEKFNKKFNFRVNGIIYNNDNTKILIHQIKGYNFWILPGGRVEMGEDSQSAIIRELTEELQTNFKIEKLIAINESFFDWFNKKYHEIGFFYKINPLENEKVKFNAMCQKSEFTGVEGENYIFKWIELNKLQDIDFRPTCIIDNIVNNCNLAFSHNIIKNHN